MEILNDDQRRLLSYIRAANRGGHSPTPDEVTEWVLRPHLIPGKVTRRRVTTPGTGVQLGALTNFTESSAWKKLMESANRDVTASMKPFIDHIFVTQPKFDYSALLSTERVIEEREPDETLVEQAGRFRWIESSATGAGLVLTSLGRALLRSDADLASASEVTVLDGDDPLAWGALVGTIAEAGACLIVDPYLKPEQFLDIAQFTGTTRVIMLRPEKEQHLIAWQLYQALPGIDVQIRVADRKFMHDRYIVGENAVYGIGCSLNGVGNKPTTLVPHSGEVADRIRDIVEGWWNSAEPIGDPPTDESDDPDEVDAQ